MATEVQLPPAGVYELGTVRGLVTQLEGGPLVISCNSPFGPRAPIVTPTGVTTSLHGGSDFAYVEGAPILNPTPWKCIVTAEGEAWNGYGNVVFVMLLEGPWAGAVMLFAHLKPGLHAGRFQIVEPGGVIGQMGTTGASTGAHLHFGVVKETFPVITNVNDYVPSWAWYEPIQWLAEAVGAE